MNGTDAYNHALQAARRNEDGSVVEGDLINLIAANIDFDEQKERQGRARRIVALRKRPGQTAPEGQIVLPDLDLYPYEPDRLLADDDGHVIENRSARLPYKVAEAKRAQADASKALERARREQSELGHFAMWTADELTNGRPPAETTWDACVHESSIWKDVDPEPEPEPEPETEISDEGDDIA